MDSLTKRNIDLLKRYKVFKRQGAISLEIQASHTALHIVLEILQDSDFGHNLKWLWMKLARGLGEKENVDMEECGHLVITARALLYLDRVLKASAINIVEKTMKKHPRHI